MTRSNYRFIHLVNLKDIPNWSVQYADEVDFGFTDKYPIARIGSFLVKSQNIIEVQDDVEYRQVTLKINNGGVIPRNGGNTVIGSKIGTKRQHLIHTGQFIMSKIDARNGAYGIVPEDLDGAIVSNDFPVFDVDADKIIPQFLVLVSTTDRFIEFARKCSSGTTNRKRIDVDAFLKQQIPLPSLEEQNKILMEYNENISASNRKRKEITFLFADSQRYLQEKLGIKLRKEADSKRLLKFINLKDTSTRWDAFVEPFSIISNYPIDNLGNYILRISTGTTPPTSHPEYFNGQIKFFTPVDLGDDKFLDSSSRTISAIAISDKKARLFHKGDILFVGIGSTVGKVGIIKDDVVSSNQQITGFTIDSKRINPEYVYYYLFFNRKISTADQSKTTLPIVNQEKICRIPIVVPSLKIQNEIVTILDEMYLTAKRNEIEMLKLQENASSYLEQLIFG